MEKVSFRIGSVVADVKTGNGLGNLCLKPLRFRQSALEHSGKLPRYDSRLRLRPKACNQGAGPVFTRALVQRGALDFIPGSRKERRISTIRGGSTFVMIRM